MQRVTVAKSAKGSTATCSRMPCSCQARIHELIRNCMGCGKIVCAQEGSGPCVVCGTLVCTREERQILERRSRKSAELYKKLTGETMAPEGTSLAAAISFRNTLLVADMDSERRTHVNDLESDFSNVQADPFLSKEEKDVIMRRRQELRQIREKRKKTLVVNFDIHNKSVVEKKAELWETEERYDPVIQRVMEQSENRRRVEAMTKDVPNKKTFNFLPKYTRSEASPKESFADPDMYLDAQCFSRMSAECMALEVERKGFTIPLGLPEAALVAYGLLHYIRWEDDPSIVGPIFVVSTPFNAQQEMINEAMQLLPDQKKEKARSIEFVPGSILGRAYLSNVYTLDEYQQLVGGPNPPGFGDFVLHFTVAEPLLVTIPYISTSKYIFQMDNNLRAPLSTAFSS